MTENKPPYQTETQQLPTLVDLLTKKQRRDLASNLVQVLSVGYGELSITVRGGKIRFMRVELSHEFSEKD